MTELDQVISAAYASQGKQDDVNKVYLTLLRSALYIPVKKEQKPSDDEPFYPLFAEVEGKIFLLAFDTMERLTDWAGEQFSEIGYVDISGKDLIAGLSDTVYFILNLGSDYYKEFSPEEVMHLKKIVGRIEQLREQGQG